MAPPCGVLWGVVRAPGAGDGAWVVAHGVAYGGDCGGVGVGMSGTLAETGPATRSTDPSGIRRGGAADGEF